MMKKKRLVPVVASCLLVGAMFTGGALAYLTDTETTTNVFTVGDVGIDVQEPNYPGNGSDEVTDLVPNEEVDKDPQIKNTKKNNAIVFVRVDIPMAEVMKADDDGSRLGDKTNQELFEVSVDGVNYPQWAEKWVRLTDETAVSGYFKKGADGAEDVQVQSAADADYFSYLFGYENVLKENETTDPIFEHVRLINVIEDQADDLGAMIDNTVQEVKITAYAIQADNLVGLTDESVTGEGANSSFDETMNEAKLYEIWKVYWNQSSGVDSADADGSNDQTLKESTTNLTITAEDTHLELNTGDAADGVQTIVPKLSYTGHGTAPKVQNIQWTSSNEKVATVENGVVTAKAVGETVITATIKNPDTDTFVKAKITFTVDDFNAGN